MKILLAVDGSEYSLRAAAYVSRHAGLLAQPPEIHVLHVHPALPYPGAAKIVGKKAIEAYQREESEAVLEPVKKSLVDSRTPPKYSWLVGEVTEAVGRYVAKNAIDLIVVGSHGRGAVTTFALGSVTLKLLAALKTPVLVVR